MEESGLYLLSTYSSIMTVRRSLKTKNLNIKSLFNDWGVGGVYLSYIINLSL